MRVIRFPQRLIHNLNTQVNPAFVEACMRLEHRTLSHLSRDCFAGNAERTRQEQKLWPPELIESTCESYGLLEDYQAWEQAYNAERETYQLPS